MSDLYEVGVITEKLPVPLNKRELDGKVDELTSKWNEIVKHKEHAKVTRASLLAKKKELEEEHSELNEIVSSGAIKRETEVKVLVDLDHGLKIKVRVDNGKEVSRDTLEPRELEKYADQARQGKLGFSA